MSPAAEVVVLGGGPAGAAAARLLAVWGRRVLLLPGARPERARHAESLPPSCRKPLALLGVLDAVEGAGFLPTRGNSAAWAEPELRATDFPEGTGFQVERDRLDALLVGLAAAAGVEVREGAVATAVAPGRDGAWVVWWRGPDGEGRAEAPWVIDCTGRAGILAARHRVPSDGPATIAVSAVWRAPPPPGPLDPTHTLVESYADGWAWSVPVDASRRHVAVMLDPAVTRLRGHSLRGAYLAEIGRTRHTAALLAGAERLGAPHACSATPYAARRYGGEGFLLAGDAGSFIDPLSSFGVKKALASGWLAAVVANTALADPARAGAAVALHEERERLAQRRYAALAADHYARAAEHHGTPFWLRRAGAALPAAPEEGAEPGLDAGDPRVAGAFAFLRAAPRLSLRPAEGLRRVARPTVEGREVVLAEHLVLPGLAPARFLGPVDLPRLLDVAAGREQVPEILEAYARAGGRGELPELLRALSALLAFGALEAVPSASPLPGSAAPLPPVGSGGEGLRGIPRAEFG